MKLTIVEKFDLNTTILTYIILNPEKLPDMNIPNLEHRMGFHPIRENHNTGFIAREIFDDDEQRDMYVEINIQNPNFEYIKYSIPLNANRNERRLFKK